MEYRGLVCAGCVWLALAAPAASGQTLEERAARVRELIEPPPPVETVIDRGTRTIGRPAPAGVPAPSAGTADSRLAADGIQLAPEAAERLQRLLTGSMPTVPVDYGNPRGSAFADDPRGTALRSPMQGPGPIWLGGYAPGILVNRGGDGERVGGTANLRTGGVIVPSPNP
jgi:hypothetical protein